MLSQIQWKKRLVLFVAVFAVLLLLRIIFVFYNLPPTHDAGDIAIAYLRGLRFDLATIPLFLTPGVLLSMILLILLSVSGRFVKAETRDRLCTVALRLEFTVHLLWSTFLIALALSSIYNYSFNGKHVGWEFSAYLVDLPMLARASIDQSPVFSFLMIGLVAFMIALAFWLPGKLKYVLSPAFELAHVFLWILVLVVMFRGGFQESPIRTADALKTGDPFLDQLSLNGVFTVSRDLSDREQFRPVVDPATAIEYTRSLLDRRQAFLSQEFPLLRFMEPRRLATGEFRTIPDPVKAGLADLERPNIVILILESASASLLARHGGDPNYMPFLNRISRESIYFERFFASGGRSANGIFSMFAGIPDRAGRTILRSSQMQNRFGGLGMLLKENGYTTSFYHGGDASFDNLDRALPRLGFDLVIGQDELEEITGEKPTSPIGYDDARVLQHFSEALNGQQEPFLAVFFSQSTHHPFSVPSDYSSNMPAGARELKGFFAAARFMDHSVERFFQSISNKPYFTNTIFVIVADHSHHAGLNYLEDRHIPLMIYAPGRWAPEVRTDIASQLDLLPTILALSGGGQIYSGMGRDLTSEFQGNGGKPFAFFAGGSDTDIIGWIEEDRILFKHFFLDPGVLLPALEPVSMENLAGKEPDVYTEYLKNSRIFYQLARTLEKENSIWPDSVQLENIYRSVKTR